MLSSKAIQNTYHLASKPVIVEITFPFKIKTLQARSCSFSTPKISSGFLIHTLCHCQLFHFTCVEKEKRSMGMTIVGRKGLSWPLSPYWKYSFVQSRRLLSIVSVHLLLSLFLLKLACISLSCWREWPLPIHLNSEHVCDVDLFPSSVLILESHLYQFLFFDIIEKTRPLKYHYIE